MFWHVDLGWSWSWAEWWVNDTANPNAQGNNSLLIKADLVLALPNDCKHASSVAFTIWKHRQKNYFLRQNLRKDHWKYIMTRVLCLKTPLIRFNLPGELERADQVKYTTYKDTTDDCSRPERVWRSCTEGRIETTLIMTDMMRMVEIKNFCKPQLLVWKQQIHNCRE